MDNSGKVIIVNQDNTEMEVEVVTYLNSKDSMNQYIVYSKGENQPNGDGITKLEEIVDDDEWKDVQKLLKEIANA